MTRVVAGPGPRGWFGRGGGRSELIVAAPEWRGTTVQVCGLWPFAVGTGSPIVGVPLGRHLFTHATVCCDPISWFQRAKLISNPSAFVMALPGRGKSTLVVRMATGSAGFGAIPLVLGDLKPDYVDMVTALGGQVIRLGRARGFLNVLDPGDARAAVARLRDAAAGEGDAAESGRLAGLADELLHDARSRRLATISSLLTVLRGDPPSDREETILAKALSVLDERPGGVPVLSDLLGVIQEGPPSVRAVALDRDSRERYEQLTEHLEASLVGLLEGGRLGDTFAHATSTPMLRDRPVVFDISGIDETDEQLQAATLLACWSAGFATVNVASALADAGLEPRRNYLVIIDELHRALRVGRGLVDRFDLLTRLNRAWGVGQVMITHTMKDLTSLRTEQDRMVARGFIERAGIVIAGGLPPSEMADLSSIVELSEAEKQLLTSWSAPPSWDPVLGTDAAPPGRGNFLIKVGGRPGIPMNLQLTEAERRITDTNSAWRT
ncbi:MAG: ATP/GTP-binding protein [Actinomycetota bacterium]